MKRNFDAICLLNFLFFLFLQQTEDVHGKAPKATAFEKELQLITETENKKLLDDVALLTTAPTFEDRKSFEQKKSPTMGLIDGILGTTKKTLSAKKSNKKSKDVVSLT